ncbi:hypothetical protein INS49_001904 [Diaporthe citri]|uniref:uncharacterized protein n=1 Tax=Diaporthe citri TaxID=83186 RepID=UPI001C7F697D|nr:uncharacterized protein INS49_001904 [Diaporthe citri]KAG6367709.1 hypothetical protein INS49_001904 [Diaporthe citri]
MASDTVEEESPRVVSPASTASFYDAPMSPLQVQKEVSPEALVVGTTQLFENDSIRFVPMPTPSPKDPLNLPPWRKWAAVAALSLFGALALAAENVIGAMVPVFVLEYAGVDPKVLGQKQEPGGSPLMSGMGGPPLWKVSLLASLPLMVNGIASYFLVPLTIAIGRRLVLLATGAMAWSGGLWAGYSTSLNSHLAAGAFQGLGAGAVEALVPLVIQDFMFIHERNRAISLVGTTQGLFVLSLGISAPYVVLRISWRYLYYITAGPAGFGLTTSSSTFNSWTSNFGMFNVRTEWGLAARSVWEMIKTTFFPNVLWVILINSMFTAIQNVNAQVVSSLRLVHDKPRPTNQRAEITGIIMALEWALEKYKTLRGFPELQVTIYSDSQYAVRCMNDWIYKWCHNGWLNSRGFEVINRDLIERASHLDDLVAELGSVDYVWIRREDNEAADDLCRQRLDQQDGLL